MPLYGQKYSTIGWELFKYPSMKNFIEFNNIIMEAKNKFEYKSDDIFVRSVKLNTSLTGYAFATYDVSKTNIDISSYQVKLESLIKECNKILSKKHKYDNYKFDITGSWNIGNIVIMKKK